MTKSTLNIPEPYEWSIATKADGTAMLALVTEILTAYGLPPEPSSTDADLLDVETVYADGFFGKITLDKDLVATFGFSPIAEDTVEIRKMYLHSQHRGKGLGKWMLEFLLQEARQQGFRYAELETHSNLVEAIGLYQSFGFKPIDKGNKTKRCDSTWILEL